MTVLCSTLLYPLCVTANCWKQAGQKYHIDPNLLKSIATIESGMKVDAIHLNTNGSYDVGIMQINSMHFPRLKKKHITKGILLTDACVNVMVGTEILHNFINLYGYNWFSVGAYHAGGLKSQNRERLNYALKVSEVYSHYYSSQNNTD